MFEESKRVLRSKTLRITDLNNLSKGMNEWDFWFNLRPGFGGLASVSFPGLLPSWLQLCWPAVPEAPSWVSETLVHFINSCLSITCIKWTQFRHHFLQGASLITHLAHDLACPPLWPLCILNYLYAGVSLSLLHLLVCWCVLPDWAPWGQELGFILLFPVPGTW